MAPSLETNSGLSLLDFVLRDRSTASIFENARTLTRVRENHAKRVKQRAHEHSGQLKSLHSLCVNFPTFGKLFSHLPKYLQGLLISSTAVSDGREASRIDTGTHLRRQRTIVSRENRPRSRRPRTIPNIMAVRNETSRRILPVARRLPRPFVYLNSNLFRLLARIIAETMYHFVSFVNAVLVKYLSSNGIDYEHQKWHSYIPVLIRHPKKKKKK